MNKLLAEIRKEKREFPRQVLADNETARAFGLPEKWYNLDLDDGDYLEGWCAYLYGESTENDENYKAGWRDAENHYE